MALSAFDDVTRQPQVAELRATLGRSAALWERLITQVETEYAPVELVWNHAGARYGWSLRLRQKKRVILYLTPCERHFLVGLVLGEKAVAAARAIGLTAPMLARVEAAPRYAEGRGLRLAIRAKADLEAVLRLVAAKMTT
jgi:hypothetical protein